MTTTEPQPQPNSTHFSENTPSRETEAVKAWADWIEEELVTFDNLDGAIIGIGRTHTQPTRVVYSYDKIITLLLRHGMDYTEAVEFFDFNIAQVWAGENTPVIVYDLNDGT